MLDRFLQTFLAGRDRTNLTGQTDPRLQGRCIPHNLQTIKLGTSDGWISVDELGVAGQQGNKA